MSDNPFVHLHVHTEYSLLDGLSRINKLVNRAKDLNMPALAITDHGTMFGVIDFYRACKAADIKPIIGVETYLARRSMRDRDPKEDKRPYHMLLLAQNEAGYKNLLKIASASQLEGYYYRPRIDREFLAAHAEGIIATSGCLAAQIPSMVIQGKDDEARELVGWYQEVFGKENFYLELQQHDIPELETLNKWIIEYGKSNHTNVPMIATNDVHYVLDTDYDPHDTLLCIQTGALKSDADRLRMSDPSYHLTSQDEMWHYFGDAAPEALKNTLKVAEMCDVNLDTKGYHLPVFPVPDGFDSGTYLRHLCEKGLRWRYGSHADDLEIRGRLSRELGIIHDMGFDTYFLIVWDLCQFARHADIWWNVRGSGAGSVAAYSLGITNIDPIQNNLLFERFLNPGRVSMPDIDMDFPDDRRGDMIDYTARKYGEDKVAAIITFGTMGAKAAVRDVGRALDVPLDLVNQAARMIPTEPKPKPVKVYVDENPELKALYNSSSEIKKIVDTAASLQGVSRHASTHAAGVIVADKPLVEYIPLHRPTKIEKESAEGETENPLKAVTQFPMETCESIGLLKIDFLGLSTLTIMRKACDLVEKHHGIKFTMDNIPYRPTGNPVDDKKLKEAFEMIGRGDTVGVFQVEGSGMQQMLRDMRPTKFEHIIAAVSLYRPGPMEFIPAYNKRLRGEEIPEYKHPLLEPILEETFSVIIYQEQIMQIASSLFGYELGEADLMRRAVSKKKAKDLKQHRDIFMERGPERGVDAETASKIFDEIEFFANYGFNKCVVADTEIVDAATGRLVKIGDLAAGKVQVEETLTCDLDTMRLKPGKISAVMVNGVKPVYRLTTQLGRQIEATANHPFYTFDGWRMLGELNTGDQIAVPRRIPVEGSVDWDDEQLVSLGKQLAQFESPFSAIPDDVFTLSNRQIEKFLAYVFAYNGPDLLSIIGVEADAQTYCTTSERVIRQLHHLLLRLGIVGHLMRLRYPKNVEDKVFEFAERIDYEINIDGSANLQSFLDTIGSQQVNLQYDWMQGLKNSLNDPGLWRALTWEGIGVIDDGIPWSEVSSDTSDLYWDKIASIEYVGEQPTYDLTIEGTHNFIANDILVHNSHAADYAVITCQTAYLKAHYPHEYLTALLSTHRDDIAKITTFLGESRRMGIPVLPPDVNYSELDFDIQQQPDGKRGIRSGMAAIKNAGEAALQPIIQARAEGGSFTSLEDFCERVDLRQVQKRTLESLIKVGAMEAFGNRNQLMQSLDRLMSVSSDHHKAKEVGQISMFGESMGMSDKIVLPAIPEVPDRERLNWEKELLGLYVSGRPADKIREDLRLVTTVDILEAKEAGAAVNGKSAVIAGEVVSLRKIPTKNGQMMAVATVEDWHDSAASTEVVLFPRTWDKFADLVQESKVLFFSGKLDTTRGDLQMICEGVKSNWDTVAPEQPVFASAPLEPPSWAYDPEPYDDETGELAGAPEPPEPDYMTAVAPATQGAAAVRTPALEPRLVAPQVTTMANGAPAWAVESASDDGGDADLLLADTPVEVPPRWLMIYFKRGEDADKDRRRLTRLHGILTSYPGEDRFTIVIEDRKQTYKMEFPNHTTSDCEELRRDLLSIVGEDNIEVFDGPQ